MRQSGRAVLVLLLLLAQPLLARADSPGFAQGDTRYLVMGDSLGAGQGAVPQTQGYAYLLYVGTGVEELPAVLFSNIAASGGVTSEHVLAHQVPLAAVFRPDLVTLTVGGNDLLTILEGADPNAVLTEFGTNLFQILAGLCSLPVTPRVFVANQFDIPELTGSVPGGTVLLDAFNDIVASVVTGVQTVAPECPVRLVDVHGAFLGRTGLLLIERHGAGPVEVHPTNAGHRVIADAFRDAIDEP
jgi:lysophospholipase L1-like esterase